MSRSLLRKIYWSRLAAPIRTLYYKAPPPPTDTAYWDGEATGAMAPRLGRTLSVNTRNSLVANLLAQFRPSAKTVIDFGCAGGTLAPVLLDRGFTSYFGVDISAHSIRTARLWNRETPGAKFTQGTIEQFEHPQGDATRWNVAVFSEVLYYLDLRRVRQLLVERASLLSPDGIFCISLNLHPQGRAFQREISPVLQYLGGFIYQEKTEMDDQVRVNRERALFHTFVARLALNAKNQT